MFWKLEFSNFIYLIDQMGFITFLEDQIKLKKVKEARFDFVEFYIFDSRLPKTIFGFYTIQKISLVDYVSLMNSEAKQ